MGAHMKGAARIGCCMRMMQIIISVQCQVMIVVLCFVVFDVLLFMLLSL